MVEKTKKNQRYKNKEVTQPIDTKVTEKGSRLSEYLKSRSKDSKETKTVIKTDTKKEELEKSRLRARVTSIVSGAVTGGLLATAAAYIPEASAAINIYRAVNLTTSAATAYLQSTGAIGGAETFALSVVGAAVAGSIMVYSIYKDRQYAREQKKLIQQPESDDLAKEETKKDLSIWEKTKKAVRKYTFSSVLALSALAMGTYVIMEENNYIDQMRPENIKMAETLNQDTKGIEIKLRAIKQSGVFSALYLVNGRTEEGWWYQGGLDNSNDKFGLVYEVWNDKRRSVVPGKTSGIIYFSGNVNEGDTIVISEKIEGKLVKIRAKDLNTGATAKIDLKAHGKVFKGGEINGQPTGLFTEIWAPRNFDISGIKKQEFELTYPKGEKNPLAFMSIDTYQHKEDMYNDIAIPIASESQSYQINYANSSGWRSLAFSNPFTKMQITGKMNILITEGVPEDKENHSLNTNK